MEQKERQILVTVICSVVTIVWYVLHVYNKQVADNMVSELAKLYYYRRGV